MTVHNGLVEVTLTAADPAGALAELGRMGIPVEGVRIREEELLLSFSMQQKDLKRVRIWAEKRCFGFKLDRFGTVFTLVKSMARRPVLLIGVVFLLFLSCWLPTRILFIRVEGNQNVPSELILEQAEYCGISFGIARRDIRSEKVKNALLQAVPKLQWAGVNTRGCVAVIKVRERSVTPQEQEVRCVCSLVADRDGIITRFTVTGGNCQIRSGQAVKRGEVLVSGYTDCGICIRAEHSGGEIFAETGRELTIRTLSEYLLEGEKTVTEKKYALIIGKNRINLYKGSGISGIGCDKIYSEYYMTLPGGFRLPVKLVTETVTYCLEPTKTEDPSARQRLEAFADAYLPGQMVAGRILSRVETVAEEEGFLSMQGYYACEEMIARRRSEEIIKPYGNDD
ncbi:MAG: hypothetical protein E7436_05625 [Ruminococcaceae bacterium]|nr:hypothetical protein [Oscillospiraceae bacterium]